MYYHRLIEDQIVRSIQHNPVTAIVGPRQCGKSTLARYVSANYIDKETVYLDLERPSDLRKLENPEWFLSHQRGKLVCLDEIQRKPELFPLIRSLTDEWGGNGHFLVLGSASRDLLLQSSESLAGRITYQTLTPFLFEEIKEHYSVEEYMVKGGFPRSLLQKDIGVSYQWREDFITTFLERDLLQWYGFSTYTMRKLWQMLAHLNGQTVNYNQLAASLSVSNPTVKNYTELLAATYMLRLVKPYLPNINKRLVKSPKVYLSDTGILNALLGIENFEQLTGHPGSGSIWETLVLMNIHGLYPQADIYFYRTGHGAEVDFIMQYKAKTIALECKLGMAPKLSKGNFIAMEDTGALYTFVVAPVKSGWKVQSNIEVVNLSELKQALTEFFG